MERLDRSREYSPPPQATLRNNFLGDPIDPRASEVDEHGRPKWNCRGEVCTPIYYIKVPITTDDIVMLVMLRGAYTLLEDAVAAVNYYRAAKALKAAQAASKAAQAASKAARAAMTVAEATEEALRGVTAAHKGG